MKIPPFNPFRIESACCHPIVFSFDISKEKEEKDKNRREIRLIWKKKLIENPHLLAVSEKKFFDLQKIKSKKKKDFLLEPVGFLSYLPCLRVMTGLFKRLFLPHRFWPVWNIKQTYKSQIQEGA